MTGQPIQLTAEEMAVFIPFHQFISQRRAELDAAERLFLEHLLSARKATNGPEPAEPKHDAAPDPASDSDDATSGTTTRNGWSNGHSNTGNSSARSA